MIPGKHRAGQNRFDNRSLCGCAGVQRSLEARINRGTGRRRRAKLIECSGSQNSGAEIKGLQKRCLVSDASRNRLRMVWSEVPEHTFQQVLSMLAARRNECLRRSIALESRFDVFDLFQAAVISNE